MLKWQLSKKSKDYLFKNILYDYNRELKYNIICGDY